MRWALGLPKSHFHRRTMNHEQTCARLRHCPSIMLLLQPLTELPKLSGADDTASCSVMPGCFAAWEALKWNLTRAQCRTMNSASTIILHVSHPVDKYKLTCLLLTSAIWSERVRQMFLAAQAEQPCVSMVTAVSLHSNRLSAIRESTICSQVCAVHYWSYLLADCSNGSWVAVSTAKNVAEQRVADQTNQRPLPTACYEDHHLP